MDSAYDSALTSSGVSQTLALVQSELFSLRTAREIVQMIVGLHPEYGNHRAQAALAAVQWPEDADLRRQPVPDWYEDARSQLDLGDNQLNGTAAIIGIALAERATGRRLVQAGLFALMVGDLINHPSRTYLHPGLGILSARGRERLDTIPLAALDHDTKPYVMAGRPGSRAKLSPDGRRAVLYGPSEVSVWQVDGSRELHVVRTPGEQRVLMARFTADGAWLVALLADGTLVRWRAESLTGLEYLQGRGDRTPFGGDLAKDASCGVVRWRTGLTVLTIAGNQAETDTGEPLTGVALGPDGRLIAASTAQAVEIFEWTGAELQRLAQIPMSTGLTSFDCGPAQVVAATPAGVLVIYGDGEGLFADVPPYTVDRIALSADGTLLAVAGNGRGFLVQPANGIRLAEFSVGQDPRLSFSLDSRRLIVSEDGTAQIWDVGVEPPGRPSAAKYHSDTIDSGPDLLGRNRDAEAFASLIAASAVQPPLSIGVFGDWGSGKSWFMRQIKRRVAEIAADARASGAAQRDLSFYKNIAQVEFNAWHYAETDVLTGLVEHIFNRLDTGDAAGFAQLERNAALRALAQAEEQAGENADLIRDKEQELAAIEARRREREQLRDAQAAKLAQDALRGQERSELAAGAKGVLQVIGWTSVADGLTGLIEDLDAASDQLRRANPILTPLGDRQGLRRRQQAWLLVLAAPALAVVAGVVVWLVAGRSVGLTALGGLGVLITGIIAAIGNVVRTSTDVIRKSLDDLAEKKDEIEASINAELAEIDQKISSDLAEETAVRQQLESLQSHQRTLRHTVETREETLAKVRPERLLQNLIETRVQSGDYSRHLGVLAQARHDFEKVSDLIKAVNDALVYATDTDSSVKINRIVLYIDDLDRCESAKVATVLQAVHLLLAFPLFMVVVGVDSRWVERALRKEYPDLLAGKDVEPRDYLEKIFQIPYWLDRMDQAKTISMLRGIAGSEVGGTGASAEARRPGYRPPTLNPAEIDGRRQLISPVPHVDRTVRDQIGRSRELNPRGLDIQPHELAAMERLSGLLGRSPRSLKRFVNVYRLMKVRAPDPLDFSDPDRADADYLVVLLLLAEMIGRPNEARALFDWIRHTGDTEIDAPSGWPRSVLPYQRWIDDVSRFGFEGRSQAATPHSR
jgi:hypothetical protein